LKEGLLFDWAKPANSDRDQQSDSSKCEKNDDGRDVRTTRPQEPARCWRQTIFIGRVFIIFRQGPLSAIIRAAHLFAFSPSSTCGWPGPVVLVDIDWWITGRLPGLLNTCRASRWLSLTASQGAGFGSASSAPN
jgi:hypothetical protein